ncbi:hypothetical protein RMATCC62417_13077 [Rhizopus microsporus]|nr:hypothetical protein RMATCC62417_13077 [Rhizopus microsporus]
MEEKSEVNTPTDSLHPRNNNDNSSSSTANGYTIGQQGTYGETDVNQVNVEAYNLDIYAFVAAFLVASVSSAGYLVYKAYLYIQKNTNLLAQQKSKGQKLKKI